MQPSVAKPAAPSKPFAKGYSLQEGNELVSLAGHSGGTHSFTVEERRSFTEHINQVLADDPDLKEWLPMNPHSNDLFKVVAQGLLLCKFVNKVKPGTIPENQICKKKNPNTFEVTNNLGLALEGARKIGCNIVNIGPQDLANQTPHLILGLIWQVIRIDLLGQVSVEKHPEMMLLKEEHEDALTFASVTPEQNLLRWVNYHLKRAGTDRRISNFSSDIRDAVPYTYLLNQLAPGQCSLDGLREPDPLRRAELALQGADRLGCRKFVTPEDIVNGNAKLNLAFVAYLFNRYPGLEAREADDEAERRAREAELKKVLELKARAEEEARAAQAAAEAARREHEERLRRLEEEEAARRRQWELEEAERRRRWEEEEARRKREWEEAEARRRQQEEEMKRRAAEMLESQRREMEERQRQEEEARRRQWQAEEEARRRQRQIEEEARRRQQAAYEEEMRRRQQAEEEARKKAEYDAWLAQQQQYYAQTTTTTAYYPQAYQTYYQTYYAQPTAYVYTQPTTYVTGQTWPIPRMFVSVMEGRQLVKKDWMGLGKSDPYAVVECKGRRFQTTYQKNTQYPVWGETFEFNQVGQNDELRISIWDYDSIGKHDFMGEVIIKSSDFINQQKWYELRSRPGHHDRVSGEVLVKIQIY